ICLINKSSYSFIFYYNLCVCMCVYDSLTGPPSAPKNCVIKNSTDLWLSIHCDMKKRSPAVSAASSALPVKNSNNDSDDLRYHLQVFDQASQTCIHNPTNAKMPNFRLQQPADDGGGGRAFQISIYASNRYGRSPEIRLSTSTLSSAKWRAGKFLV